MNSSKIVALAIVGIMIASGFLILTPSMVRATDWSSSFSYSSDSISASISITIGPFINTNNDSLSTWYLGPTFSAVRTAANEITLFTRNAHTHVGYSDYGTLDTLKTYDNGQTCTLNTTITNNVTQKLDLGEATAGITDTGRIIVAYFKKDVAHLNYSATNTEHGILAYKYSDNGGVSYSTERRMYPGVISGFNCSNISVPHGNIQTFQNGRIGFAFFAFNLTWGVNQTMVGFAYSDDNGLTWHFSKINSDFYDNESTLAYLGNGWIVAMTRTVGAAVAMETSTDNGLTWTDRGNILGLSDTATCPILSTVNDNRGNVWVLAQFIYNTFNYSIAYGPDLVVQGATAWASPHQYAPGGVTTGYGQSGYTIMDQNTGIGYAFTDSDGGAVNVPSFSLIYVHNITVTIHADWGPMISPLLYLIPFFLTLGIVLVPVMKIVEITKQKRMIRVDEVIRMFVTIIVGFALVGITYVMI